jgi:hypothetical protein
MVNYEKNVMKFSINLIENTLELLLKIIAAGYVSIAIKFQVKLFVDFFLGSKSGLQSSGSTVEAPRKSRKSGCSLSGLGKGINTHRFLKT